MNQSLCTDIGLMGIRGIVESPKESPLTGNGNDRDPLVLVPFHTQKATLGGAPWAAKILLVVRRADVPNVPNAVVPAISVDVVNLLARKLSMNVQPCKPMCQPDHPIDADHDVPIGIGASGDRASRASAAFHAPAKYAGLRIVVKYLAKTLRAKISYSHEALQLLIGQKPQRVSARLGLRHFLTA
jgi:hypothetical protein